MNPPAFGQARFLCPLLLKPVLANEREARGLMKILFVMELRLNAGSIQAVSSYIRTGHDLGYDFAVYGTKINGFESIKFAKSALQCKQLKRCSMLELLT